jgi:hypothetical protein
MLEATVGEAHLLSVANTLANGLYENFIRRRTNEKYM